MPQKRLKKTPETCQKRFENDKIFHQNHLFFRENFRKKMTQKHIYFSIFSFTFFAFLCCFHAKKHTKKRLKNTLFRAIYPLIFYMKNTVFHVVFFLLFLEYFSFLYVAIRKLLQSFPTKKHAEIEDFFASNYLH